MKKIKKKYIFSDGSVIIDDMDGMIANMHQFWNPNIICIRVEDIC